jgi:hypothetical protein
MASVRFVRSVALVLTLLVLGARPASGQITSQTGAVRITVADSQGASVSGAKATLNSAVGSPVTKETTSDGTVVFPLVTPGAYKISIDRSGFRRTVLDQVVVNITEVTNLSVTLEVGELTTEIVVSADAAQTVNTTNATLGNTLSGDVLHDLPLASRNFAFLLALNAGTSAPLPDPTQAGRGSPLVFVNGQRGTANNLVINGTDSNNLGNNNLNTVPIPSPDSLEEFRVQTSLYDASQGKTSGGNINVLTRGGTNLFHGEAYEYFRNDVLNANLFFFDKNGTQKPVLKQNQFGGNFGGPVPRLKDTFFFVSYQGTRQLNGVSSSITSQFPIIPASRNQTDIETAFGLTPGSLNPVALGLLNLKGQFGGFLIPTGQGTPVAGAGAFGLFTVSKPLRFNEDQFNANVDRNIGSKHRISERFFFANALSLDPLGGEGAGSLGSGQTTPQDNRLATLAWTYTVNANLVNEARFGYNRITQQVLAVDPATTSQIGLNRFNSSVFPGIPLFFTNDINPAFGGISTNNDQASVSNTFHFADTVALTHGKHTFRGGFEFRRYEINLFNNFASRGFLFFNTFKDLLRGNILQAFVGSGQTDRGFRARDTSSYFQDDWKLTRRLTLNLGIRYDFLGPATDVKGRLGNFDPSRLDAATLANGGPGLLNGFVLPASANFGTIKGTPGVSDSTLLSNSPHNFAPRVGFAFDPKGDGKTAIRGGYGIYYVRTSNQTLLQLITGAPFFQLSSVVAPGTPLSNPFPTLPLPAQFPVFPTPPSFLGFNGAGTPRFSGPLLSLNPFDRNLSTPYAGSWNLSVQRDLPAHFNIEIGYLGSQGVKLIQSRQLNQAHLANAANPIVVGGANGVPTTTITTVSARDNNARVGVLGFSTTGLNTVTENGHSNYNAFVFTLNRRTTRMFIQGAYTFSRSIDNNSGNTTATNAQDLANSGNNQLDTRGLKALSNFDRTHRIQATYQYNIPGFAAGALHHVLGGWSLGGLTTFQSGLPSTFSCTACINPFTFGTSNVFGLTTGTLFPQVTGSVNNLLQPGSPQNFTNQTPAGTGAFTPGALGSTPILGPTAAGSPANGTTSVSGLNTFGGAGNQTFTIGGQGTAAPLGSFFGNLGRNVAQARGPFQQQWDAFITKTFPIHERLNLQFRTEFYNLFNHPNFAITNLAVGSPSFGVYDTTVGSSRLIQFSLKLNF